MKKHAIPMAGLLALLATPAEASLIAHFSFDSDFTDLSGNGNHLSVTSGAPSITTTAGESRFGGGALNLNQSGVQQHLALTTTINFDGTSAWSMAWWASAAPHPRPHRG